MKILMAKPDNYDVVYSINPWMNVDVDIDKGGARDQWYGVYNRLVKDGVEIQVIDTEESVPDMVFAANAGMIHNGKAIVSKFRDPERALEEKYFEKWFRENGFDTFTLPKGCIWEGEACSVFIGNVLICSFSHGGRSNKKAYEHISRIWNVKRKNIKYIELIDPYFYHLDVSFCLINSSTALVCPLAFRDEDYQWIKSCIPNIIEVSYDDALSFGCNAFVHNNTLYISDVVSNSLISRAKEYGISVVTLKVTEYIKAGGAVKCLILNIN